MSRPGWSTRATLYALVLSTACRCDPPPRSRSAGSELVAAPAAPAITAPPAPAAAPPPAAASDASAPLFLRNLEEQPEAPSVALERAAPDATDAVGSVAAPFVIDSLVDVGPAAPAVASQRGVVLVDRENRMFLARLRELPQRGPKPLESALDVLPENAGPFQTARGPAQLGGVVYWVSRGELLGQTWASAAAGAAPQVLARDARVGTRVAVPVGPKAWVDKLPRLAAYIARPQGPDDPASAKLWIEGRSETLELTTDNSSAHSIALAATPGGAVAVFLEARTGMSSIHVRGVQFGVEKDKPVEPKLGPDQIAWVGGPGRASTEIAIERIEQQSVGALLALERDVMHFGLVQLQIPWLDASEPVAASWLLYENGIEPAPFAAITLCDRPVIALARPSSATPRAPQELVLVDLSGGEPRLAAVIARSKAFFDISLAESGQGALLVYVADHRTWARTLHCTKAR